MTIPTSQPSRPFVAAPRQVHELRLWPACFRAVEEGRKPFDVREDDHRYEVGDALVLREYEPETEQYTDRRTVRWISYLLRGGRFGIEAGWCVIGFSAQPPLPPGITDTRLW